MHQKVVFVHAHPDDESISTGGTIATLVARGDAVTVVTCTRGEQGEVIPADLKFLEGTDELAEHRVSELSAALAELGVTDHRFLGEASARWEGRPTRRYLDSGMRWGSDGAEASGILVQGSLTAAEPGEVAADIAAVLIAVQPDVVVSYAADGGYGHPDHRRAHEATRTAAEVIGVPFYVIDTGERADVSVDVTAVIDRKRAALAHYATQLTVTGDSFVTPGGATEPITTVERFSRLRPPGSRFRDHSLGSRIVACAMALLLGAVTGATLTVAHQSTVGGFPWGIVAALGITAALLVGLRLVFATRLVPALAAVGLIGASGFLALTASGTVVPDNPSGWVWVFAPLLIAAVVLAWPRMRVRANDKIGHVPAPKGSDQP